MEICHTRTIKDALRRFDTWIYDAAGSASRWESVNGMLVMPAPKRLIDANDDPPLCDRYRICGRIVSLHLRPAAPEKGDADP